MTDYTGFKEIGVALDGMVATVDISNGDFVFSLTESYLIEDGKIAALGPDVKPSQDAQIIDGSGLVETFVRWSVAPPRSVFQEVYAVPPGVATGLTWSAGGDMLAFAFTGPESRPNDDDLRWPELLSRRIPRQRCRQRR